MCSITKRDMRRDSEIRLYIMVTVVTDLLLMFVDATLLWLLPLYSDHLKRFFFKEC